MHKFFTISDLRLMFSWKLFLFLTIIFSLYHAIKKYEFTQSYTCTIIISSPTSNIVQQKTNIDLLRTFTARSSPNIDIFQMESQIFKLSSTSSDSEAACASLDFLSVYFDELNARVDLAIKGFESEVSSLSELLSFALEAATEDSYNFEKIPELDRSKDWLLEALNRKILLNHVIHNPSLLKFSIKDKRIDSNNGEPYLLVSSRLKVQFTLDY